MNCNGAEALIMRYMDGEISDTEARRLQEHIAKCDSCREEFHAYDEVVAMFLDAEIVEAPSEFEERVMARIACITPNYIRGSKWTLSNVTGTLWGIYCIIFGLGIMAIMYRDALLSSLAETPALAPVVSILYATRDMVVQASVDITESSSALFETLNTYLVQSRVVVLPLLAIIIAAQVVLSIKNKGKVEAK